MNSKIEQPRSKSEWRTEMRKRISLITAESDADKAAREDRVAASLIQILSTRPGIWLSYVATREEPVSLQTMSGVEFAYPYVVSPEHFTMKFYASSAPGLAAKGRFLPGRFGLREPDMGDELWREVRLRDVTGVLIPGLGFDRRLRRLGRGAGFYDRFLKDSKVLKIGVGFHEQVADELPHEPHDVGLDGLVTDHEVIWKVST